MALLLSRVQNYLLKPFDWGLTYGPTPLLQTWSLGPSLNLLPFPPPSLPKNQFDWPLPTPPPRLLQTWPLSLVLTTLSRPVFSKQVYDLVPRGYPEPATRTWAWSYNPNLIGQDQLPIGERIYDLSPIGSFYPYSLRSWISSFPLTLIPTEAPFVQNDWPVPKGPVPIQQSWAFNLLLSTLLPLPSGKQFYDLAPKGYPEPATRTWTWQYNLNLISQDAMTVGDQVTDLPPRGPEYHVQLRSWIYFTPPTPVFAIPNNQFDWPNPRPYPEPATRTWTWSYNLNLISQDATTAGKEVYDLAPIAQPQILPRSWTLNLQQTTLQPLPYGKQFYDRPPLGPIQPLREWARSYNLNLIGQDQLPPGDQYYDEVPYGPEQPDRTWITFRNLALDSAAGQLPAGKRFIDLPPRPYPEPATRTWAASFPLFLRGRDAMVTGEQITDLPPRDHSRSIQLRTWTHSFPLVLRGQDRLPNRQQDWPVPKAPQQPNDKSWTFSYNLNLIGKDRLPVGEQLYARTPPGYITPTDVLTWIYQTNLALNTPPGPKPFNQQDWPVPKGYQYSPVAHTWTSPLNLCLPIPPPPLPVPPTRPKRELQFYPGLEWQPYDRMREPGPIGWR